MKPGPANPLAPYLALAGIWLLTVTMVPPRGDFPLNDDWIYAKIVQHLVETGEYQPNPYGDPTFIAQAYWGAAFVKLFGFSFETLRLSTLVLGLVAVWGAHWAAREAGLTPYWAFLVALTLLVNPLFMNLSYTFMTDVPFIAIAGLSGAATLRALRTGHLRWLAIAMSLAGCAMLIRQFAIVIPLAVSFILFDSPETERLRTIVRQGAAFVTPLVLFALLYLALPTDGPPVSEGWDWRRLGDSWTERIVEVFRHLAVGFTYLALMSAPVFSAIPFLNLTPMRRPNRSAVVVAIVSVIIFSLMYTRWPHRIPNLGNLLYDIGVGPLLLPGMVDGYSIDAPMQLGASLWWIVTCLAVPGAAAFALLQLRAATRILSAWKGDSHARIELFVALWTMGLVLVLILPPILARFDRYFVMAQVPATILVALWFSNRRPQPPRRAFAVAAVFWGLGIIFLQDYLAWNGARWSAIGLLRTELNAPLEEINAGYEPNGWFHSDQFVEESRATGRKVFGPLGWWTVGETYRVSMRPNRGYEVIGSVPYFSWLGFRQREMLLLRRLPVEDDLQAISPPLTTDEDRQKQ